jgi:asparaginyl-tRNA synthetase
MRAFIEEIARHEGQEVELRGWVYGKRSKGKIHFLILRDGTGFLQATVVKGEVPEEVFQRADRLPQETALKVFGLVRKDERAPGGYELAVRNLEVVSLPQGEYPIGPKEHGIDFLMDHRHLWLRHRRPFAVMRIRDELERGIHEFFGERGFLRFDAPILTPSAVEGTTDLFEVDLFDGEKAYLSQSGQLYAEAGAMAYAKVYTFGPTFRAERSKTRRHLLEFWMVEPEVAFMTHEENMALQEELLRYLVGRVLERRARELEMLERDPKALEPAAQGNYPRLTYKEAVALVNRLAEKDLKVPPSPTARTSGPPTRPPSAASLTARFSWSATPPASRPFTWSRTPKTPSWSSTTTSWPPRATGRSSGEARGSTTWSFCGARSGSLASPRRSTSGTWTSAASGASPTRASAWGLSAPWPGSAASPTCGRPSPSPGCTPACAPEARG